MSDIKTIEIIGKSCTACRACEQVCPKNAIKMIENKEGFLYPDIDKEKCINCGVCLKSCHIQNDINERNEYDIYGVKPIDSSIAQKSTSGGFAQILSEFIINNGGYVYGAYCDECFNVKHICVCNIEDLEKLRGSKYVISDTLQTYKDVREKLINKHKVLYIGTACQISGLKAFLKRDFEELLTVDIVCHGVPSNKLFKKYIKYLEEKIGDKIISYEFRNKDKTPWGLGFTAKAITSNKITYLKADYDPYYINFLNGNIYRESCYSCKYASIGKRLAEITIADFWGIEKFNSKFYDKSGVSLCIVNNPKGSKVFNDLKDKFKITNSNVDEAIKYNLNLKRPTSRPKIRDYIYNDIDKYETKKYILDNLKVDKNIKVFFKNSIPYSIKEIIKKIF